MIPAERRKRILELIETKNSMTVTELCELFDVSEMTIRRDLRFLDREGLLQRVHGGAILHRGRSYEPTFPSRRNQNARQKEAIGRKAAALVNEGDSLALDVGTTTLEVARALVGVKNLTIITSSLPIANVLANAPGIRLILSGGIVREFELSMIGHVAARTFRDFRVDKAFIGIGGLDLQNGLTEYSLEDALVKQVIIDHAEQVIITADSSKLGQTCFAAVAPLSSIEVLITDTAAPPEFVEELQRKDIDVILA